MHRCLRRLAVVHLVDAHLCTDASKYMSALLLSLTSMLHLEMPHVNVLSKMDMIQSYGQLAFNLDFYTEVDSRHKSVASSMWCCCLTLDDGRNIKHAWHHL